MKKAPIILILLVAKLIFLCGCIQNHSENDVIHDYEEIDNIDSIIFWESMNGPPGGNVYDLIQDPKNPNELYAVTQRNVYKSEDKGENWEIINVTRDMGVNSIALYEDKLFLNSDDDGVFYYDNDNNLVKIFDDWCKEVIVSDNKLFLTFDYHIIDSLKEYCCHYFLSNKWPKHWN